MVICGIILMIVGGIMLSVYYEHPDCVVKSYNYCSDHEVMNEHLKNSDGDIMSCCFRPMIKDLCEGVEDASERLACWNMCSDAWVGYSDPCHYMDVCGWIIFIVGIFLLFTPCWKNCDGYFL